ncbi:S-adenosyl-L-methionine-dependent methyltransferase [Pelagophyceae sp. CCMP2097]|nr:S-adenosyl-L-methionine-dependent methyltransferase [Pelagophyceae sp. CCMP2097]
MAAPTKGKGGAAKAGPSKHGKGAAPRNKGAAPSALRRAVFAAVACGAAALLCAFWSRGADAPAASSAPGEAPSLNRGSRLLAESRYAEALAVAEKLLEAERDPEAHLIQGLALLGLPADACGAASCRQRAAAAFANCLQQRPVDENCARGELEATLDMRVPAATAPAKVAAMFDKYAETFEDHLTRELRYTAPATIAEYVLRDLAVQPEATIVDVGCGTGLVGAELRRRGFEHIFGYDLSPNMVAVARDSGKYAEIGVCDARRIAACAPRPDVVVLADVLVYLDDSSAEAVLVGQVAEKLRPQFLVVTLEAPSASDEAMLVDRDWRCKFGKTGRYAHNARWLAKLLDAAGYDKRASLDLCAGCEHPPLRLEKGEPVPGNILVFQRRAA